MITGLPPYSTPSIQSLRCKCGLCYVVLIGAGELEHAARMEAERIQSDYVDARKLLAFECYCGEMIDVSSEATYTVQ